MYKLRKNPILKTLSKLMACYGIIAFIGTSVFLPTQSYAQSVLNLPTPGTMVALSPSYNPAIVAGITIYLDDPLQFDFIIDVGDDHLQGEALRKESEKLISYFMATLTVPEDEMWVNLSPYEKDRIIADGLGNTVMGRDMLAQDYILKQLTASMMYPEDELGNQFWQRVYQKAQAKFGTTEIPTDTFNKIWIVPQEAVIYANGTNIFVADSHLKVMLEEDYLALEHHDKGLDVHAKDTDLTKEAKTIIKEILLPEIEKEVNEGKNFATLRQIYHSMILATWYKNNLKESLLGKVYANQNKVNGVDVDDKEIKHKIYNQYIEAFKKGVYNYIREDRGSVTQEIIPRKYFSGGEDFDEITEISRTENVLRPDYWLSERRSSSSPIVSVRTQVRLESERNEKDDGRGYDGLPNDEYTEGIKTALIEGEFASFQMNTNGEFVQSDFVVNRDIRNQTGQERKAGIIETNQQNMEPSADEVATLNDVLRRMDVSLKLKDTVIVFIQGQRAHYSVGRSQIYLDVDLLKNPYELRKRLAHEITERTDILENLSPSLKGELNRTSAYPELRSRELKNEIERLAKESHARLKMWESMGEALNDVEFAESQFGHQMDAEESKEPIGLTTALDKQARNIIGFYGLETGVATVANLRGKTILEVLESIEFGNIDNEDLGLIAAYSHATWMVSNASRGLKRTERFVVAPFSLVDAEEKSKAYAQVRGAAVLLSKRLKESIDTDADQQDQQMAMWFLLRNEKFALEIGEYLQNIYDFVTGWWPQQGEVVLEDEVLPVTKHEEGVVRRFVPLYALMSAIDVIHSRWGDNPQQLLSEIISGEIFEKDGQGEFVNKDKVYVLARFANATWKAQQPYRGVLEDAGNGNFFTRLKRSVFKPFDLLPEDEKEKDFVYIKKTAQKLSDYLEAKSVSSPITEHAEEFTRGGIDFNANNLNLKEQGQSADINFTNLPVIEPSTINGITPVIINIAPITNFPLLLGESEREPEAHLSQL